MKATLGIFLAAFCHMPAMACWEFSSNVDPMTDKPMPVASCAIDDGQTIVVGRGKSGEYTLAIGLRRYERFYELPTLRIDDAPAFNLRDTRFKPRDTGPAAVNLRDMVVWRMNSEQAEQLRHGKRLLVKYRNLGGESNIIEFDLTGAAEHIARIP